MLILVLIMPLSRIHMNVIHTICSVREQIQIIYEGHFTANLSEMLEKAFVLEHYLTGDAKVVTRCSLTNFSLNKFFFSAFALYLFNVLLFCHFVEKLISAKWKPRN